MKKLLWALPAVLIALLVSFQGVSRPAGAKASQITVWVELDRKRLTVYEDRVQIAVFPIASGARETPSPVGVFHVNRKFLTALSGFGTRFLGLDVPWGDFGIHGTNAPSSIGRNASHGCIRLRVRDAETLYRLVPYGARVVIEGGAFGAVQNGLRTLMEGDRGADVLLLQRRLIQRRYLSGAADGVFGPSTRRAVLNARKEMGLSASDRADAELQTRLGIILFE